jgi:hypothetical protein
MGCESQREKGGAGDWSGVRVGEHMFCLPRFSTLAAVAHDTVVFPSNGPCSTEFADLDVPPETSRRVL